MKNTIKLLLLLLVFFAVQACRKDWLDAKSDKALVVPSTLNDYQALLDNSVNTFNINQPSFGEIACGDFYITYATWQSLYTNQEKNGYIWAPDIYAGTPDFGDWNTSYQQVFYANVILEGIKSISPAENMLSQWDNIKGSALFYRAYAFYNLIQTFAKQYDKSTAAADPGVPLRLESDVKKPSVRASVEQVYEQLTKDLLAAAELIPTKPKYKTRPSKTATYAMLARVYLCMGDYQKSFNYADSSLQLNNSLIDFTTLDSTTYNPLPLFNEEDIFHSILENYSIFSPGQLIVDSALFQSYSPDDLRRAMFYTDVAGEISFRGSYDQTTVLFGGLATDEMYLTRAECAARNGNAGQAMADLNTLLQSRWRAGKFVPLNASSPDDALNKVLQERRKELAFRGIRWNDLRRLNKEPRFAVTLTREINGKLYTLPPGDPRYVFPIPDNEIQISGLAQNPR